MTQTSRKILCAGVYLAYADNAAPHIRAIMGQSSQFDVTQRWTAIAPDDTATIVSPNDIIVRRKTPRFTLLNRMVADHQDFDWIIICDDDIQLEPGFLDAFMAIAERADFALFQPARTHDSFIDHYIVAQSRGLAARRTNFVEIGPLVCIRRDAARLLIPFNEQTRMGWGIDLIWPVIIANARLRMGIIDATPITHRMRAPATAYNGNDARAEMRAILRATPHIRQNKAFRVLEAII